MPSTGPGPGAHTLLRHVPELGYFAKDGEGRFIAANLGFAEMIGLKSEAQVLGKTDFQVWPAFLAEQYVKDDARVAATGAPLVNKVELVLRRDRTANWFATTKVPVVDAGGRVVGVEGVCRHLKKAKTPAGPTLAFPAVLEHIMENYPGKIDIPALAAMASLSVKQFERKFKREYGMVPVQYIQRIRLDAARQLLAVTGLPISRIGRETGFYDSSHFSRQFAKDTGLSPKAFREKHRQAPE